MDTVKITMLGPSRVGKTSLLAAMCDRFNHEIQETELQIDFSEAAAAIQEQLIQLKSIPAQFKSTSSDGVAATMGERKFNFGIGKINKPASLQFEITDFPGEYFQAGAEAKNQQLVKKLVYECAAVIVTIDAPALMEVEGRWNDKFNRPFQITQLFKTAYKELKEQKEPRLVLLAPVKCEKYSDPAAAKKLRMAIKTAYKELLDFFKSEDIFPYVTVVITPVQTIGTVVYSHVRVKDNDPYFYFQKKNYHDVYDPQHSEQPLRYLLRFFLKLHLDKRIANWGIFGFLHTWLKQDTHLKNAIQKFASGCKDEQNSHEFEIIQGRQWL